MKTRTDIMPVLRLPREGMLLSDGAIFFHLTCATLAKTGIATVYGKHASHECNNCGVYFRLGTFETTRPHLW